MKVSFRQFFMCLSMLVACQVSAQNYNITQRGFLDFPGQTLANVCGWTAPDGHEYGLLGASKGLVIVDLANPDDPKVIVQLPGPDNLWKEIKVYKHYAYVTSEGGQGVQIVDLRKLPSPNVDFKFYTGNGGVVLNAIHALHIDTTKGFLYLYGGNQQYATIHALEPDPYDPKYVGFFSNPLMPYVHDGYANNDTLYACHIYGGKMSVVDCRDKANPVLLGDVTTPNQFTHNCWPITSDRHILLTTDERDGSYLTAYDTRDPQNIRELDRLQCTPGSGSVVHNTHVLNDFAVTSWYTDGVNIVDVKRPENLVQVGWFDTYAGSGGGFDGCWGVFPFFPSGNIITTNIGEPNNQAADPTRMYVLTPTYKRACYLEGVILDGCTGTPLSDATIKITSSDPNTETTSKPDGQFKTGQPTPGNFLVTISKPGYVTQTKMVSLTSGQITTLNLTLEKGAAYTVEASVRVGSSVLANQQIHVVDPFGTASVLTTNGQGKLNLTCITGGNYKFGFWGGKNIITKSINVSGPISLDFERGYYDDFEMDLGWSTSATATSGLWVRAVPVATQNGGVTYNPGSDAFGDANNLCYTTGNAGGQAGTDDVDDGQVILVTPITRMSGYISPELRCQYWFANGGGSSTPNDKFTIRASNGLTEVVLFEQKITQNTWVPLAVPVVGIALTDNMRFSFIASDDAPGHLVEAAVDIVRIESTINTNEPTLEADLRIQPNPFTQSTVLQFQLPEPQDALLEVIDALGSVVDSRPIDLIFGQMTIGERLPNGVYFVRVRSNARISAPVKMVKQ